MRPLVVLLSITTLTFAGTTVYYARELTVARGAPATAAGLTTPAGIPPSPRTEPANAVPAARGGHPPRPDPGSGNVGVAIMSAKPLSEADVQHMQAEFHRKLVARAEDPQGREEMRAQQRLMLRNMYSRVDKYLGLSASEHAQLMNLIADQQIDMQLKSARCALDAVCSQFGMEINDNESRAVADLLGPERAQKFESYKNTMGEREAVNQLRSRLSDNARLPDDSAEGLVAALAEERAALHREAAARGEGVFGFGMGAGTLFAPSEGSFESRYEGAKQNSQRLRTRASQVLNKEQMRVFDEMQDELLMALRAQLRNKEEFSAAQAITISSDFSTTMPE